MSTLPTVESQVFAAVIDQYSKGYPIRVYDRTVIEPRFATFDGAYCNLPIRHALSTSPELIDEFKSKNEVSVTINADQLPPHIKLESVKNPGMYFLSRIGLNLEKSMAIVSIHYRGRPGAVRASLFLCRKENLRWTLTEVDGYMT